MYGFKIQINGQTIKIVEADHEGHLMGMLTMSMDQKDPNKLRDILWWAGEVKNKKLQINDEITFEVIKLSGNIGPDPVAIGKAI